MAPVDGEETATRLIRLEFECDESTEISVVRVIAQALLYFWGVRAEGETASLNLKAKFPCCEKQDI